MVFLWFQARSLVLGGQAGPNHIFFINPQAFYGFFMVSSQILGFGGQAGPNHIFFINPQAFYGFFMVSSPSGSSPLHLGTPDPQK